MSNVGLLTFLRRATFMTLLGCFFLCSSWAQEASAVGNLAPGESKVAPSQSEKSPGEQLLDFMMNPPEKYDFGATQITIWNGTENSLFFRLKKSKDSFFDGRSKTERSIIGQNQIGNLENYVSILSRFEDIYWDYVPGQLTTWTNQHDAFEQGNKFVTGQTAIEGGMQIVTSLYSTSHRVRLEKVGNNQFFTINYRDEVISTNTMRFNEKGYLIQQDILLNKPEKIQSSDETFVLSKTIKYYYSTNTSIPFFPAKLDIFRVLQIDKEGELAVVTNKYRTLLMDHLDLSPTFTKNDFDIVVNQTNNQVSKFWIQGTNEVYVNEKTGQLERVLTHEEVQSIQEQNKLRQSKYRRLYVALFIIFGLVFFGIIRKKIKYE